MENIESIKQRIANNDSIAFDAFYNFYFDKLFAFSLRFLKSKELAEEVISDVFLNIWINRKKLTDIKYMDTYLYVLVKNKSLDVIKKSVKDINRHLSIDENHVQFVIENFTPEKIYFAEELRNEIDQLVQTLPTACKNAFLLIKEDQLSYKEAGEILNISPHTVKKQALHALKIIRAYLDKKHKRNTKTIPYRHLGFWLTIILSIKSLTFF